MIDLQQTLAGLLEQLALACEKHSGLAADREAARAQFHRGAIEQGIEPDSRAEARFYEWYLFEHRSPRIGDGNVYIMVAPRVAADAATESLDLLDEMGANRFCIFEPSPEDGEDAVRDISTQAVFHVHEGEATDLMTSLADGSVGVGRLYPTGAGTYLLSPAGFVASGHVAKALRTDLGEVSGRQGKLSQREMEWLLFGGHMAAGGPAAAENAERMPEPAAQRGLTDVVQPEPLERLEAEVDAFLRDVHIEGLSLDEIRERFESAPTAADAVNPLMEEIAFESDADLEPGRRILPAYYFALHQHKAGNKPARPGGVSRMTTDELQQKAGAPCRCGSGNAYGECCLPKDAIARFDAGRARGEELNGLIQSLANAMGIESLDADAPIGEEEEPPPSDRVDPVMAPMVEEYLWEMQQLAKPVKESDEQSLRRFATSIDTGAGAPEDPSGVLREHLDRYFSLDCYQSAAPPQRAAMARETEALGRFAEWLRDEQGFDIVELLREATEAAMASSERLGAANQLLGAPDVAGWNQSFRITGLSKIRDQYELVVEPLSDPEVRGRMQIRAPLGDLLKVGDCLLTAADPEEGGQVGARLLRVLPAAASPYIQAR